MPTTTTTVANLRMGDRLADGSKVVGKGALMVDRVPEGQTYVLLENQGVRVLRLWNLDDLVLIQK